MKKLSIIVIAVVIIALVAILITYNKNTASQGNLPQPTGSSETGSTNATTEATVGETAAATTEATEPSTAPTEATAPTQNPNKVDTVVKDDTNKKDEDIKIEIDTGNGNNQGTPNTPSDDENDDFVITFDDLLNAARK